MIVPGCECCKGQREVCGNAHCASELNSIACKLVIEETRVMLLQDKVRRLRAMVLRAHVAWFGDCGGPCESRRCRRGRLLNHYASAIEAGRL